MTHYDRRRFLSSAALGLGAVALNTQQFATAAEYAVPRSRQGYHGPVGIQLYTLGDAVRKDIAATFATLVQYGFREIEALEYADLAPATIRRAAADAGLLLRSVHLNFGQAEQAGPLLDIAGNFGVTQVASSVLPPQAQDVATFIANVNSLSVDDFKRIAERANRIGERARRAGLRYAYHNHNYEFRRLGRGVVGYDILLRETDPALVQFEADCGWIRAAGADPLHYLRKFPERFSSIHVKNFDTVNFSTTPDAASQAHVAAFGSGVIDYLPILNAALEAGISYMFLEHDPRNGVPITTDLVKQEFDDLNGLLGRVRYDPSSGSR
jgi:sugar phosphate isomerase/epimerase